MAASGSMKRHAAAALSLAASAGCWGGLAANTALFYALGMLSEPLRGPAVWGPILRAWARINLACGGFVVKVEGSAALSSPAVLVANHQSAFDICLLAAVVPPPLLFVARRELFAVPIIGGVLARGRHVPVDRGGREAVRRVIDEALERLSGGARVLFFAEGSRSLQGSVAPFRGGAFHAAWAAGCPLVPVALAGTRHAITKGSRLIRPCRLAVHFLHPVEIRAADRFRPQLRQAIRRDIAAAVQAMDRHVGPRLVAHPGAGPAVAPR